MKEDPDANRMERVRSPIRATFGEKPSVLPYCAKVFIIEDSIGPSQDKKPIVEQVQGLGIRLFLPADDSHVELIRPTFYIRFANHFTVSNTHLSYGSYKGLNQGIVTGYAKGRFPVVTNTVTFV